jgi:NADH:ubiquinone oxidoreductase subunit 2 (subunit N)
MTFQMSDLRLIAPHIVILAAALVVLLVEAFGSRDHKRYLPWVSIGGIVVAAILTPGIFGLQKLGFAKMYAGDGFAARSSTSSSTWSGF